jgi:hypothetical protein
MKLRLLVAPICDCGQQLSQQSYLSDSDGVVLFCHHCWIRYFVPWTYVEAMVMPELRKEAIERKPE